jgi:hypothetical protein
MLWSQVVVALLEQYVQWRYGPLMAVGLFIVLAGWKVGSPKLLCVGGILIMLVILSW